MTDEKDIKVRELEARNELSRIAYNQIEERIEKLKAENAELREALKHEVDLNAMNLSQCEKLKAENAELRHNFEQDRKVIANLKAQISKSQERVDQLIEQNRQRRLIDKNIRSLHYWHPAPDQTTYEEHVTGKCSCGGKR